jgi:hypothetical protein
MRVKRVVLAAFVAGIVVVPGGSALAAPDPIDTSKALPDIEVRGTIKPTQAQRTDAKQLGSQVAWNQFGTPSSLIRPGGALGGTVAGATAADAARSWVERNKALFKLSSTKSLELASDSLLAGSDGHAVTLRQTFNGLDASGGGLLTLGVAKVAGAAGRSSRPPRRSTATRRSPASPSWRLSRRGRRRPRTSASRARSRRSGAPAARRRSCAAGRA